MNKVLDTLTDDEVIQTTESSENPNVTEVSASIADDSDLIGFEIKINGKTAYWHELTQEQQKTVVKLYWNGFDFFIKFLPDELSDKLISDLIVLNTCKKK